MADRLTDRELVFTALPAMPPRTSPRVSSTKTLPTRPKTFEGLEEWPGFLDSVTNYCARLDNSVGRQFNPSAVIESVGGLAPPSKEGVVETNLEAYVFPFVNAMARNVGLAFTYAPGGSGRSISQTDMVILDSSRLPTMIDLSSRVFGCGEVKGPWAWNLDHMPSFMAAFLDAKKSPTMQQVSQQLFGYMVMDEAKYGFITNYNQTIFFRRPSGQNKVLEVSPTVSITDAPLGKFLFVLAQAEQHKDLKPQFSRAFVKTTPQEGYRLKLTVEMQAAPNRRSKRRLETAVHVKPANRRSTQRIRGSNAIGGVESASSMEMVIYEEHELEHIPTYDVHDLGFTGSVVGFGRYGTVLKGVYKGLQVALKTFDIRHSEGVDAFVREQKAYRELRPLQGDCVPILLQVGRLAHTGAFFLALTLEQKFDFEKSLSGRRSQVVQKRIMDALFEIHNLRLRHGDLKLSNMLGNPMKPKFIDFEFSTLNAHQELLDDEKQDMEELFSSCLCS